MSQHYTCLSAQAGPNSRAVFVRSGTRLVWSSSPWDGSRVLETVSAHMVVWGLHRNPWGRVIRDSFRILNRERCPTPNSEDITLAPALSARPRSLFSVYFMWSSGQLTHSYLRDFFGGHDVFGKVLWSARRQAHIRMSHLSLASFFLCLRVWFYHAGQNVYLLNSEE